MRGSLRRADERVGWEQRLRGRPAPTMYILEAKLRSGRFCSLCLKFTFNSQEQIIKTNRIYVQGHISSNVYSKEPLALT